MRLFHAPHQQQLSRVASSSSSTAAAAAAGVRPAAQLQSRSRQRLQPCRSAQIELPPSLQAELEELEKAQYCGTDGGWSQAAAPAMVGCLQQLCGPGRLHTCCMHALCPSGHVLVRQAPADVPKNGKRYHIHTFGCQVGGHKRSSSNSPGPQTVSPGRQDLLQLHQQCVTLPLYQLARLQQAHACGSRSTPHSQQCRCWTAPHLEGTKLGAEEPAIGSSSEAAAVPAAVVAADHPYTCHPLAPFLHRKCR